MKWQRLTDGPSIGMGSRLDCAALLGMRVQEAGFLGVRNQVIKVGIFCFLIILSPFRKALSRHPYENGPKTHDSKTWVSIFSCG